MTWDVAMDETLDTEMKARIRGVSAQMEKFNFFFGIELGRNFFNMVDNLSRSLQSKTISACEGQNLVNITLGTLQKIRDEDSFNLFWKYLEKNRSSVSVDPPTLPRKRKVPRRFEIGEGIPEHSETATDYYRRAYFEAIDFVVEAVNNRPKQKGYNMLQNLEALLTTKNHQSTLKEVTEFYTSDFIPDRLQSQLSLFHSSWDPKIQKDLKSVISFLQSLSAVKKEYFSEVIKVIKLILVMPTTNATN